MVIKELGNMENDELLFYYVTLLDSEGTKEEEYKQVEKELLGRMAGWNYRKNAR